jgi:segregation and condensation protein A
VVCTITLPSFEGPLDLLLYLVEKQELDITEINVATVAQQYLAHLKAMREMDLDLASEFYLMAVRLLAIKARALLPRAITAQAEAGAGDEEEDPRKALIRELVEYRRCRQQAALLEALAAQQALRFPHPAPAAADDDAGVRLLGPAPPPSALAAAYDEALRRAARRRPRVIAGEQFTVRQRMAELLRSLRRSGATLFSKLRLLATCRRELIVTFLALLELARRRRVVIHQQEPFADFQVRLSGRAKEAGRQ